MSLNYIITSPLVIDGPSSSELFFQLGGNSINLRAPTGLSSTYEFVLPPTIGTQDQVLTLNSSLETEWRDNVTGRIQTFSVSSASIFSTTGSSYQIVTDMELTPPAGTYYCIFSSSGGDTIEYIFFVDNTSILSSVRRVDTINRDNLFTIAVLTVNGSEDITVRARNFSFSGAIEIRERSLTIYEVS